MTKTIGKVKEVFIPQVNNVDIMDIKRIGFKIEADEDIVEYIFEQDEFNANIMKNDLVVITKQTIDNQEFIDIEKFEGDSHE